MKSSIAAGGWRSSIALLAVAHFRQVMLGQILYAGDDLSGENWDNRGWQSRAEVRESLFWLAADACLEMGTRNTN